MGSDGRSDGGSWNFQAILEGILRQCYGNPQLASAKIDPEELRVMQFGMEGLPAECKVWSMEKHVILFVRLAVAL